MSVQANADLLEKVMDRLDGILFKCGLFFKDSKDWAVASGQLQQWVYENYDDEEQDASYQPGDSEDDGNADSQSLGDADSVSE